MYKSTQLLALALLPAIAFAQGGSTEPLKDTLLRGTSASRIAALEKLGIPEEQVKNYADKGASLAGGIEWLNIFFRRQKPTAIVFLPCLDGSGASTTLLIEEQDGEWKTTDSESQDCHYNGAVSVRTAPLQGPKQEDVIVEHDTDEHGTGYISQNAHIYEIRGEKLVDVLTIQDKLFSQSGEGSYTDQDSILLPVSSGQNSPAVLEETRIDHVNFKNTVRRYIYWSSAARKFKKTAYKPVRFVAVP